MAAYHLGGFDFERVREGRAARAGHELADHQDQEGHVAQFFDHIGGLAGADGVHEFVALFNDIFGQRFRRLRAVPRTAVRCDEAVDDGIEAFERGLRGGVGSGGRGGGIGHEVSLFGSQLENVGRQQTYPGRTGSSSRKGKACGGGEKEPFLRKVPSPLPHTPSSHPPKIFDWWGGCAEGVRSDGKKKTI